jgi:hypothetical protein
MRNTRISYNAVNVKHFELGTGKVVIDVIVDFIGKQPFHLCRHVEQLDIVVFQV